MAILWVLLVGIVAGNATVVLALLLTKSRKSRMNFFIMQLAIAGKSLNRYEKSREEV